MNKVYTLLLVLLAALFGGNALGANLINENIQSWTNRGSYGTYTQAIPAGTVTMTQCIVANAAAQTGTCTVGRIQMNSSTGVVELPALSSVGVVEFHLAAGAAGRTVKLQYYDGTTWIDLTMFTGIGTTGATFTYTYNTTSTTTLRLASPSAALYVHDIIVTDYVAPTNTITTGAITNSIYCVTASTGVSVSVPFTSTGTFTGNTYTAQLSNASGSFATPVNIGTLVSNANSGTINATIPANTATGTGYRIRVISSSPGVTGSNNGANITINLAANAIAPAAAQTIATGANGATLTVTEQSTAISRVWKYGTTSGSYPSSTGITGTTYTPNFATAGTYYVVCESTFPCGTITSNEVVITVVDAPANDACASAAALVINDPATNGTLVGSTNSSAPFSTNKDVWYRFTPTCTGTHTITVTGFSGDVDVHLFNQSSACPTTISTFGTAATSSATETINSSLTAGVTYYVRVYAFNPAAEASNFTIRVTTALAPLSLPGAITGNATVCEGTANTYSIPAVSGATSYTWTLPSGGWSFTGSSNSINTTAGSTSGTISVTANNGCGSSPAQTLAVTVNPAPANPAGTITALANPSCGPTTVSYSAPSAAIFWQTSASGTSTASPTTTPYPVGSNGTTVYARAYNGTCWSTGTVNSGTVTINTQPNITTQPVDKTVASPTGTTFTVAASNAAGYQWQYFNGSAWVNLSNTAPYSGVATATLTIASTTEAMDGTDFRCIVNAASPCTSVTSNVATLYVTPGPCGSENFENIPTASSSSYQSRSWTGSDGTWNATAARTDQTITTKAICTNGAGSVTSPTFSNGMGTLTFSYVRGFTGTSARSIQVWVNGVQQGSTITVSTTSDVVQNYSVDINISGNVQLELRTSGAQIKIDNISWTCYNFCMPTHTITSFAPTSGPAGTLVTITGTGFTAVSGANGVQFGTVNAASYTVINATTIIAEVPAGASTDKITVVNNSCPLKSAADFTFIETDGTCGSGGTYSSDVFISEIYDHNNGSLTYIEIFNGTLSTVDLSNYSIRVQTNTTDNSYTLSGTIASNATKILKIGQYNTYTCSGFTPDWDYPSAPGINGNDRISLYKSSGATLVDYAPNPYYDAGAADNGPQLIGFTQKRTAAAVAPNTTYSASDWTLSTTQSCSHLGIGPYTVSAPALNITSHPADVNCTAVTFSVTASAGAPATISEYVWKFNDPVTMTGWDNVSAMTGSHYNYPLTITGVGTNSITITGNTAILQDFQFYVEVKTSGSPQCIKASNAAQYSYNTRKIYRSVANGNWSDATKWEMSNDMSTWIAACNYPTSRNSSQAIIKNGTGIVLDIDNDIDKLTIETTGTLEVSANSTLTVYDSTANADLIVNGTYFDRANSANSLDLSGTATWQLGASGTVIKSNTSSAANYRDQYESGIANIPATATWIYRYNGDGNPTVVSAGMFYPNLFFENTTGSAFSFNNTLMILSGGTAAASLCTVKGNCNIGTTGTSAVTVYNNNLSTSPMLIYGNLTVGANSFFTNASYNGGSSTSYGNGTGFEVKGNVTVNGTLDANTASTGILKFSGTGTQVVSGSGTFDLWNVELSKPVQTLVDQQVNLTANNNLNFLGGILKTNANVFTVANGDIAAAVTGHEAPFTSVAGAPTYANDRYVWGKLERNVNSNGLYVYPVGDAVAGEGYNPLRFDRKTGSGYATAEFIPGDPGACLIGPIYFTCNGENKFFQYSDMTGQGKWRMISSTATTFSYDIYLHPNQANANVFPNEDVTVGQLFYKNNYRALKAPNGTTDWSTYAGDPTICPTACGNICEVGSYYNIPGIGYSGFSDFAPAGGSGFTTALPVELTSFTASCKDDNVVEVLWTTATEFNSSYFILERSLDAARFETVAYVPAAVNSNTVRNYSVLDTATVSNSNYYRLTEVDQSGKRTIYSLVYVRCREVNGWNAYHTPDGIVVEATTNSTKDIQIRLYEVSGKLLMQEKQVAQRGYNRYNMQMPALAKGVYIIQLLSGDDMESVKVWVP